MVEPIRKESFESVSISPNGSVLSDTDSRVSGIGKKVLGAFSPSLSPPPLIRVSGVDRVDLDEIALNSSGGRGYKAANLLQLERLASRMGVLVPSFNALSHEKIMDHIKKTFPEFPEVYRTFVETLRHEGALLAGSKAILHHIRERVEGAFSGANTLRDKEIEEWIGSRSAEFLIVRSTGKEDSDEVSNAGGNLSVPNVKKDLREVSLEIGRVAASYFSEKSIGQRIAARDPSLFGDVHPFVPVLVQECIGELVGREDGVIPRSGVMFVKRGVSEISVGLGHNEGIVSSSVPTDTIRFTREGESRVVVRAKTTRFRSLENREGGISCEACPCTGSMVKEPALSEGVAKRMQRIAHELYDFYGKEMDVEFTVMGDQIYLLQARPLVKFRPEKEPSYLEPIGDRFIGEMITDGGSYVRRIERAEEVIVCRTIHEAYEMYTTLSERMQSEVKGIIIQERAPRTSHEAVFFMGQGLPILQITEEIPIDIPFYIDTQQGLIAKEGVEKEGYVCYPMALAYSMKESPLVEEMYRQVYEPDAARGHFIRGELEERALKIGPLPRVKIGSVSDIQARLEVMKRGGFAEANEAAGELTHLVWDKIHAKDITPKSRIELVLIFDNLIDVLEKDPLSGEPMSLERLYTVRLVEALLFQEGKEIIGGFSLIRSLTDIRSQRVGSKELARPHTEETLQDIPFVKMKKMILKDDLRSAFSEMLTHLREVPEGDKKIIKDLFSKIDSVGAGTEFVNVTLLNLVRRYDPVDYLAFFRELKEILVSLDGVLAVAEKMQKFVLEESNNQSSAQDPEYVQKNMRKIGERLREIGFHGERGGVVDLFVRSSSAGRLILIQAMRGVIASYDATIKACTGSRSYPSDRLKVSHFLEMLHTYREMTIIVQKISRKRSFEAVVSYRLPLTLGAISEEDAKKELTITPGFDVSEHVQEVVRIYTTQKVVPVTRLEERFTLYHQTMESGLASLSIENGLTEDLLPREFSACIGEYIGEYRGLRKVNAIRVNGNSISVELAIPLRDHGANLVFCYDRVKKTIEIQFFMFGGNEKNRFTYMKYLAEIMTDQLGFTIFSSSVKETSLKICMKEVPFEKKYLQGAYKIITALLIGSKKSTDIFSIGEKSVLEILPPEFQRKELVKEELRKNGLLIQYVDGKLLEEDEELISIALEQNPRALQFIPEELQRAEPILKALEKEGSILKYVSKLLLREDPRLISEALAENPYALEYVPKEMQTVEMVLPVLMTNKSVIQYVSKDLLKYPDIAKFVPSVEEVGPSSFWREDYGVSSYGGFYPSDVDEVSDSEDETELTEEEVLETLEIDGLFLENV
ncbi:MAG: DUF4116 domain-containing protein, partial [Chlamydiae bacterium]|nr:DUF4116 domain-containing protein [Chlamydiota bacterium]